MSQIIRIAETASTNILAKEYARAGADHGSAIIAENQTAGRGRLGKQWQSIRGTGLYCSIIIRPQQLPRTEYHKLTLVTGLAVALSLEFLTAKSFQLKWPNDVYYKGVGKCAGILCESVLGTNPRSDYLIAGIGINVNTRQEEFDAEVAGRAGSLFSITGEELCIDHVFNSVYEQILAQVDEFFSGNFSSILSQWRQRDMLAGRKSCWLTMAGESVEGIAEGVSSSGQLYIRDASGERHEVLSGDVQLVRA
ncbi:biotin--[acetyl-CoA-carboxylase] ligase [Desulfotalea psychrophila]|uniref:biotin--[biotin carboxyl-carrier protein] ligase n=1 Tax=Desulfotalea psychrophila (strain LSv54 / DSM 12343) TaxID=177439 RepID=Q6AQ44_DESPS|nr:biotin--[acetyl-CoA-carboxylase] ligase [Desulfotalea psychrophila]CAG35529.1 related to BirA bifunctional protein [Desulfotalea psychrophila LSv54]